MVCIIPARGGSTRLPGKNIKDFFGVPIIYHVISTANRTGMFSRVVVSTDDLCIADACHKIGADVMMRPDGLRGDVSEADVLYDCAKKLGAKDVCRIYPFAVLLTEDMLTTAERVYHMYNTTDIPVTVLQVQRYEHSPERCMGLDNSSLIKYVSPNSIMKRTQDLTTLYHDAASFMMCKTDDLRTPLNRRIICGIPVSRLDAQDVDDAEDWELLKMKYARRFV